MFLNTFLWYVSHFYKSGTECTEKYLCQLFYNLYFIEHSSDNTDGMLNHLIL